MKKLLILSLATLMLAGAYADGNGNKKTVAKKSTATCTMETCPYANTPACCCK